MRSTRTLSLRKETLAELADGDLAAVAGGSHITCPTHGASCDSCPTIPLNLCLNSTLCVQTS